MMVPFKVRILPLLEEVTIVTSSCYRSTYKTELENKLLDKVWTVVAIRSNPIFSRTMASPNPIQECFVFKVRENINVSHYENLPCMLFLLVRDGENPVWWPDKYCEVVVDG